MELEGIIVDVDYVIDGGGSVIRITLRQGDKVHTVYDPSFYPHFYIIPSSGSITREMLQKVEIVNDGERISVHSVDEKEISFRGRKTKVFSISTKNSKNVPKLSEALQEFGERYEHDIVFWKRYLIDKAISPMAGARIKAREEDGKLIVEEISKAAIEKPAIKSLCFDIETYNPVEVPRPEVDPILMISYIHDGGKGVLTTKEIKRDFVSVFKTEREMINEFTRIVRENDIDAIVGYNSSNFDLPYLIKRAEKTKADFEISRYGTTPKPEHHGLIEAVKIAGRINVDAYNVAKFISIVGASERLARANRFTLSEVYAAITGNQKKMVDRKNIWQIWDGSDADREELADYSLGDAVSLKAVYDFFIPLEIEIARVTGTTLAEACISTTGQLVEYFLMRYANNNNEIVPDKPSESEITRRVSNPIEGAYVKTPDAGVYKSIAVFDFRSLYPSIIIAYNIDPSTLLKDESTEYFESPNGIRFQKKPEGIVPKALRILLKERGQVKNAYKKDPDNKYLAARSQALKIIANSFYGYLGYARSRWYSRDCAASVTALGRSYITKTMETAEKDGFKVLYADTDSIFLLMEKRKKDDALSFMKNYNATLPETMELELEDFYVSGVFVGKRGGDSGAKKKYALLSESGRVKIRGFELVRRDWSSISRETQLAVLNTILKEGSKEKAIAIVKDVVKRLREGSVEINQLAIRTQLRKKIDSYDSKSPELSAAKKAIKSGIKTKEEMEGGTISYVVTKHGSTISEKAELAEVAKDYDADYYISHQIIPSTLKILKELGVSEEELKGLGSQKKL
ncbi:MAG TPA: DNA-directed DNA polymerase [Candidatus Saccharimonadales bacterium]|nr:DNA-directed DNA polymerase [Candidatus Saccharimonadales bacterium]